jgi:hypothetical protein
MQLTVLLAMAWTCLSGGVVSQANLMPIYCSEAESAAQEAPHGTSELPIQFHTSNTDGRHHLQFAGTYPFENAEEARNQPVSEYSISPETPL